MNDAMKDYYLKQKIFSRNARYTVFDDHEEQLYHGRARFFSPSRKFYLYDSKTDTILFQIKRKLFAFRPTYILYDGDGKEVAKAVRKRAFFKKSISVESDLGDLMIEGNYWAHDFEILKEETSLASIHKKRLSFGDSYHVSVSDEANSEFFLALVIMIDSKFHQRKRSSRRRH
ncbi:MAG: LURP-one-related/scramblase family protein [Bacillota bacterium]